MYGESLAFVLSIVKTRPLGKPRVYAEVPARGYTCFPSCGNATKRANSAPMFKVLIFVISVGARAIRAMCRRRAELVLENLALRQQLTAIKKERPRPPLEETDRAFWVALRQSWPCVGESNSDRKSRLSCPLESGTIPAILGKDIASAESRAASRRRRDSSADPEDIPGWLGCSTYPRRAYKARVRPLGDIRFALSATTSGGARPS